MKLTNNTTPYLKLVNIKQHHKLFTLFIIIVTFVLYSNTLKNGFVLDDTAVITQNKFVQQGVGGLHDILTTHHWAGYWETQSGLYRPMSLIMFALEQQVFGSVAWPWHLVNLLLYILTVVILFKVLSLLFSKTQPLLPYVTSLLFIAHPIHTEVVANIKSGDELLSFLFLLLSIYIIARNPEKPGFKTIFSAGFFFFLALMAKETAITFILILPLIILYRNTWNKQAKIFLIASLLMFALGYILIRFEVLGKGFSGNVTQLTENSLLAAGSFWHRLPSVFGLLASYIRLLLLPVVLSFDYSYNQLPLLNWSDPSVYTGLIIFAGMLFLIFKYLRNRNIATMAALFFLITYSLVSNSFILIGTTMGDRLMYVPSLGFCLLVGWGISKVPARSIQSGKTSSFWSRYRLPIALTSLIILLYSFRTIDRNADWKDNLTLYRQDVNSAPNSWKTHYCYGSALYSLLTDPATPPEKKSNLLELSYTELKRSYFIDTTNFLLWFPLAKVAYMKADYPMALNLLNKHKAYFPTDDGAIEYIGYTQARNAKYNEAIECFKYCISKGLHNKDIYLFLGLSQMELMKYQEAIVSLNKAMQYSPADISILSNLGSAYARSDNYRMAVTYYKKAFALNPADNVVLYGLSNAYLSLQKKDSSLIYQNLMSHPQ